MPNESDTEIRWLIRLRSLIFIAEILALIPGYFLGIATGAQFWLYFCIFLANPMVNAILLYFERRKPSLLKTHKEASIVFSLIFDAGHLFILLAITGGWNNPFAKIIILFAALAGLMMRRKFCIFYGCYLAFLVTGLMLYFKGPISTSYIWTRHELSEDLVNLSLTIFLITILLFLSASLKNRLALREQALALVAEERLADKKKIEKILDNIQQGVVTFDKSLKIDPEFSAFITILYEAAEKEVPGKNLMEFIFPDSGLSKDEYRQAQDTLNTIVGETSLAWDVNQHHLPKSTTIKVNNKEKFINLEWAPIFDRENNTERLMLSVRDLTKQHKLEAQMTAATAAKENMLTIISELLPQPKAKLNKFFAESRERLKTIRANMIESGNIPLVLRELHTIKAGARSLETNRLLQEVHLSEDTVKAISSAERANTEASIKMVSALESVFQDYRHVLFDVLKMGSEDKSNANMQTLTSIIANQINPLLNLIEKSNFRLNSITCRDDVILWKKEAMASIENMLMHGLTNSIDHGYIKDSKVNPPNKMIHLEVMAYQNQDSVILELRDHGAGFNMEKIRDLAIKNNIPISDNENRLLEVLFLDGMTTTSTVTTSSGRGTGLPAIENIANQLGGSARLEKNLPKGAKLIIELPSSSVAYLSEAQENFITEKTG